MTFLKNLNLKRRTLYFVAAGFAALVLLSLVPGVIGWFVQGALAGLGNYLVAAVFFVALAIFVREFAITKVDTKEDPPVAKAIMRAAILIGCALVTLAGASAQTPAACKPYEKEIERAVERAWGPFQYPQAWKAQLWQESLCDPFVCSHAGACGLAQFMPATWAEQAKRMNLPAGSTPHGKYAIRAGAEYQARMMRIWISKRPELRRWELGLASYNAGAGNILNAQKLCHGARMWNDIQTCLPSVTGHHANETRTYVRRIRSHWKRFGGCDPFAAPRQLQEEWGCRA